MGLAQSASDPLAFARKPVRSWFEATFAGPTEAQRKSWPLIVDGRSVLLLAPTGSGKTLAAFLAAINRLMFETPESDDTRGVRVLYVSPLKALGVDVERNLRAPLAGIRAAAERDGETFRATTVGVRSGDTPPEERARLRRHPPDILITTPESLYLMLTSLTRETLATVETVIVDEIHTMAATKRGSHLFLSLERLERLRASDRPLQRVGLSATQRPLDEIAQLLGGMTTDADGTATARHVEIVDAGRRKTLELTVEVPVEDMTDPAAGAPPNDEPEEEDEDDFVSGPASGPATPSIWPSIYPRLLERIRAHRSTMVFVNSRRLAERIAAALNELADEEVALAHHGSIAKDQRAAIEDRLKRGRLPAIIATSSLELGIDMGAVDLVLQIEAPPSIASGMQRIGRAGHHVGQASKGVLFPKYRGDLLACAAATTHMQRGEVEATHYPRNPLDVLAQQIVAIVAEGPMHVDELYDLVRGSAPFAELPRRSFEGVLDMLSGRYPSDRFAQFRARITWDRIRGMLTARRGAQSVAIINGGTIPDRGLYGVFIAGEDGGKSIRVGELDEEMVFEARPGEVFMLGASSWRIEDITHDRVVVTPAPGEQPKMPFWRGDRPGRPLDFGQAIGALARGLVSAGPEDAHRRLREEHGLDELAADNLLAYLDEQAERSAVPTDRTIVLERFVDEVGDWRVTLLSPFGGRVHAPWATAVLARLRRDSDDEIDSMWSDDGIVFRFPESDTPPAEDLFFPEPGEVESLVTRQLADTPLFASRFRENAARALLLPRRRPGQRTPLWVQRRRSADLLGAAAEFSDFPILLETYRDCLRDVFDLPGLVRLLEDVAANRIRIRSVDAPIPSPFASSLLYAYVAQFLYEGDAPLAERRAQALSLDHAQLRELLGEPELRELLDPDAIEAVARRLQRLDEQYAFKHADGLHDLLLTLGDLTRDEIRLRAAAPDEVDAWIEELVLARRIIEVTIAGESRFAAAEDAALLRDALGVAPPAGLPEAFLDPVERAHDRLIERYARTHGPFVASAPAERLGLGIEPVVDVLARLEENGRLLKGEFLPGGQGVEWCHADNLRAIKQRSLAKLRKQVEPVDAAGLGRFLPEWQGVARPRRGLDALLGVIEQLQGAPLVASELESRILPARIADYRPGMLDELCAAGEVVWCGRGTLGQNDGRVALYRRSHFQRLATEPEPVDGGLASKILELLTGRGALFFTDLADDLRIYPAEALDALWDLVWSGHVTNDTLAPLRSRLRPKRARRGRHSSGATRFRGTGPAGSEGRWSLLALDPSRFSPTDRRATLAQQLLERHGVLTREAVHAEGLAGGFSAVYPVLKAMEEAGRVRRGYFVAGLGATQFAVPGADDRLRLTARGEETDELPPTLVLAATDPANPYGAAIPWPERPGARPQRAAGTSVVIHEGRLAAHVSKSGTGLMTFLPEAEPERGRTARALISALARPLETGQQRAVLIETVDGASPGESVLGPFLDEAGFRSTRRGHLKRRPARDA